jgi:hypothetical protein
MKLTDFETAGRKYEIHVSPDGYFSLVGPGTEDKYANSRFRTLDDAQEQAKKLASRLNQKLPKLNVKYFSNGQHYVVERMRSDRSFSVRDERGDVEQVKYLPSDVLRPLSFEEVAEYQRLLQAQREANAAMEAFKGPRKLGKGYDNLTRIVGAAYAELEKQAFAKAQAEAEKAEPVKNELLLLDPGVQAEEAQAEPVQGEKASA